jgi:hypothetical protein
MGVEDKQDNPLGMQGMLSSHDHCMIIIVVMVVLIYDSQSPFWLSLILRFWHEGF